VGDKALGQLREELREKLREYFRSNGVNLAHYDSAARFEQWAEDAPTMIIGALTEGWSVTKDQRHLDKDKVLRDPSAPLENAGDDYDESQAIDVVVYEIETAPRPFTEQEAADKAENEAKWKTRRARKRAIWDWRDGDLSEAPPDGIGISDLLDQVVWWVTKDKRAMRIGEMAPSHRANLYRLMIRNAEAWKNAELSRFLAQGAPDEVTNSAEFMTAQEWLDQQELFHALRRLVMRDFAGEDACLIEWRDEKPLPCITGAKAHACVREGAHKKRCACQCGARPAKGSAAAEAARKARRELIDELTPQLASNPVSLTDLPGYQSFEDFERDPTSSDVFVEPFVQTDREKDY